MRVEIDFDPEDGFPVVIMEAQNHAEQMYLDLLDAFEIVHFQWDKNVGTGVGSDG